MKEETLNLKVANSSPEPIKRKAGTVEVSCSLLLKKGKYLFSLFKEKYLFFSLRKFHYNRRKIYLRGNYISRHISVNYIHTWFLH